MSFLSYEEMLKRAMERIPKKIKDEKRFRIPEVMYEIQGNKTIIKNFQEFLSVFRRDAKHFSKFLCRELATLGYPQGNFFVLQTMVSGATLRKKIESYVNEFVYCKQCGEPDTKLIKEDRIYFLVCEACGAKHSVRSI
ncbi:MAG: translation initiation factor IF-2 subunit beta [Candidatus Aenigmarchaeota archaeon]|nr:translation initiation factor IF-2 subunit beta [Candidatus Aenigmarchaeota archaeon]